MIKEVLYKGQKINLNDIEVVYTDHWGEEFTGSIEVRDIYNKLGKTWK